MNISDRRVLHTSYLQFIERLKKRGTPYYVRYGTECVEVIVDEINFFFKNLILALLFKSFSFITSIYSLILSLIS